jgi:uncharacterized cupredoxin-like copper-binding protein
MILHVRRAFAAVFVTGLSGLVAAGCGDSGDKAQQAATPATPTQAAPPAVAAGPVQVALGEWEVQSSAAAVKAGKVRFIASNTGKLKHELVVIRTDKDADELGAGAKISETGTIGEIQEFGTGKAETKTFTLEPGHYVLVCNVDGHYQQGMRTNIDVLKS